MIIKKVVSLMFFITIVITQLCVIDVNAKTGNISSKMKKMAEKFSKSYTSKPAAVIPGTLAVFPFQADEKLTKRKVDFAVGEMFTRKLIETGSFKIVERVELNRVLEEQKLGLSGAIETESAVEVGKLLGAQLLVMGSIARMGKAYQINVRLVDARTGEVISMDFIEVGVKVFEEEAKPYIGLVPEKQAIGIQLVLGVIPFSATAGPARIFKGSYGNDPVIKYSETVITQLHDTQLDFIGLGARYFPTSWLALEGTYFLPSKEGLSIKTESFNTGTGSEANFFEEIESSISIIRLGLAYTRRLSERFRVYTGIQWMMVTIEYSELKSIGDGPLSAEVYSLADQDLNLSFPMARLGIEWRPQSRIGLSLFGNIGSSKESNSKIIIAQYDGGTLVQSTEIDFVKLKFPAFYLETAFTFYF